MKYSFLISVILAVVIGYISTTFIFNTYDNALAMETIDDIYFLKTNNCDKYDTYLKIDNTNECYIGITGNIDNIKKIESFYEDSIDIEKKIIDNFNFIDNVSKYDLLINNSDNKKEINSVLNKVITLYQDLIDEN